MNKCKNCQTETEALDENDICDYCNNNNYCDSCEVYSEELDENDICPECRNKTS